MMDRLTLACASGLAPLVVVLSVLLLKARHREQTFKTPLTQRLLRPPGESLRKRIDELGDKQTDAMLWLLGLSVLSGLAGWISFDNRLLGVILIVPPLAGFAAVAIRVFSRADEMRDCHLGFLGERAVGEELNQLLASGWKVFHDVEFHENPGQKPFNVDHVVVGAGGVFAIETKTRRKRIKRRSDDPRNEVVFNGSTLVYPWGEETFGVANAIDRAAYLARWLKANLGKEVPVQPVLALPGWSVIRRAVSNLRVISGREVGSLFRDEHKKVCVDEQLLHAITALLGQKCRDVE